jgi:hypothetical protein
MTELDFESAYKVEGHLGIAWRLQGYAKEWTEESWEFVGEDGDDPEDQDNYIYHEPEEIEDRTRVVAIMIGDDREFTFDVEDVTPISEEEYCPGCGQIGCKAYEES